MIILIIFIFIFFYWQNNNIVVSNYTYESNKIDKQLNGYKIIQISDLHNKQFGKDNRNLLNILKKEEPNIIVITGDLIDGNKPNVEITLDFIKEIVKIAPIYYVTGNHEYALDYNNWNRVMNGMNQYGVNILNNRVIPIKEKDSEFYLIGLEDRNLIDNTLEMISDSINLNKLTILLAHEPQNIGKYSDSNIDLVLSGHAHGGQIRLPFIGGLYVPNQGILPKYTSGTYKESNTIMILSRGLGNSTFPIRLFNRPEVVVISLKSL